MSMQLAGVWPPLAGMTAAFSDASKGRELIVCGFGMRARQLGEEGRFCSSSSATNQRRVSTE